MDNGKVHGQFAYHTNCDRENDCGLFYFSFLMKGGGRTGL